MVFDDKGNLINPNLIDWSNTRFITPVDSKYVTGICLNAKQPAIISEMVNSNVNRVLVEEANLADIIDDVEDPFDESDFDGFAQLTAKVGKKCLICGDDLFVTNKELLAKGIEMNAANAIIIKPNQIGSLSETYATVKLAKENGIVPVVSHRSGETTDETIAHLAVGFGAPMIKTGAIGGERIAKLNELIRIEEEFPNPKMGSF